MYTRLQKAFIALWFMLIGAACMGQTNGGPCTVVFNLTDFIGNAQSVQRLVLSPIPPTGGAGTYGSNILVPATTSVPTGTNGSVTISNVATGYAYKVQLLDQEAPPRVVGAWTNVFPTNLAGYTVYASACLGVNAGPVFGWLLGAGTNVSYTFTNGTLFINCSVIAANATLLNGVNGQLNYTATNVTGSSNGVSLALSGTNLTLYVTNGPGGGGGSVGGVLVTNLAGPMEGLFANVSETNIGLTFTNVPGIVTNNAVGAVTFLNSLIFGNDTTGLSWTAEGSSIIENTHGSIIVASPAGNVQITAPSGGASISLTTVGSGSSVDVIAPLFSVTGPGAFSAQLTTVGISNAPGTGTTNNGIGFWGNGFGLTNMQIGNLIDGSSIITNAQASAVTFDGTNFSLISPSGNGVTFTMTGSGPGGNTSTISTSPAGLILTSPNDLLVTAPGGETFGGALTVQNNETVNSNLTVNGIYSGNAAGLTNLPLAGLANGPANYLIVYNSSGVAVATNVLNINLSGGGTSNTFTNVILSGTILTPLTSGDLVGVTTGGALANVVVGSGLSLSGGILNAISGGGSVTSVGETVPGSLLTIGGSPITSAGTLAIGLANAPANSVWGNFTGASAVPGYSGNPQVTNLIALNSISNFGNLTNVGPAYFNLVFASNYEAITANSISNAGAFTNVGQAYFGLITASNTVFFPNDAVGLLWNQGSYVREKLSGVLDMFSETGINLNAGLGNPLNVSGDVNITGPTVMTNFGGVPLVIDLQSGAPYNAVQIYSNGVQIAGINSYGHFKSDPGSTNLVALGIQGNPTNGLWYPSSNAVAIENNATNVIVASNNNAYVTGSVIVTPLPGSTLTNSSFQGAAFDDITVTNMGTLGSLSVSGSATLSDLLGTLGGTLNANNQSITNVYDLSFSNLVQFNTNGMQWSNAISQQVIHNMGTNSVMWVSQILGTSNLPVVLASGIGGITLQPFGGVTTNLGVLLSTNGFGSLATNRNSGYNTGSLGTTNTSTTQSELFDVTATAATIVQFNTAGLSYATNTTLTGTLTVILQPLGYFTNTTTVAINGERAL